MEVVVSKATNFYRNIMYIFFPMAQKPLVVQDLLNVEASW